MAETTGLLNRRTEQFVPRVRISSSPQDNGLQVSVGHFSFNFVAPLSHQIWKSSASKHKSSLKINSEFYEYDD